MRDKTFDLEPDDLIGGEVQADVECIDWIIDRDADRRSWVAEKMHHQRVAISVVGEGDVSGILDSDKGSPDERA